MKRNISILIVSLFAATAFAQQKADILVSYDVKSKSWVTDNTVARSRMTLLANAQEAKYFNDISLWSDSLSSTPEGKKQLQQIIMAACMTQTPGGGVTIDLRKGPVKKTYTYVFSNLSENRLRYFGKFGGEQCYYDEPLEEMSWEISDSTTTVLGYECQSAQTDYHGRRWTAWFTAEIPISFGPWKFHGLPGLILKAEADPGFEFIATGIEKTDRVMTPMYSADDYQKVKRKKALSDQEYYLNNRESIIRAKYNADVKFEYDSANRPKYNPATYAPEPDYADKQDK